MSCRLTKKDIEFKHMEVQGPSPLGEAHFESGIYSEDGSCLMAPCGQYRLSSINLYSAKTSTILVVASRTTLAVSAWLAQVPLREWDSMSARIEWVVEKLYFLSTREECFAVKALVSSDR